jgi:hypothetical protein
MHAIVPDNGIMECSANANIHHHGFGGQRVWWGNVELVYLGVLLSSSVLPLRLLLNQGAAMISRKVAGDL